MRTVQRRFAAARRAIKHGARLVERGWLVSSRPLRRAVKHGRRTMRRWKPGPWRPYDKRLRRTLKRLRRASKPFKPYVNPFRLVLGPFKSYDKRLRQTNKRIRRRFDAIPARASRRADRIRSKWSAETRRLKTRAIRRWWLIVHATLSWLIVAAAAIDVFLARWVLLRHGATVFRYAPLTRAWADWLRRRSRPIAAGYVGGTKYQSELRGIHLKELRRSYEGSFKDAWGYLRNALVDREGQLKKRAMWQRYTQCARVLPLDVPFVYVALHLQPERTTSSLGGVFADQFVLIDTLARSLPDGWKVYVKEHPSQFYPPFCGERGRHADFYRDVGRIPNVELASLSMSTFDLIDCARAVATVTGTVGWEAVIRGTPALVFGSPWYRYCEGVAYVPTHATLRAALARVEAGWRPDYRKVRLFMLTLVRVCARAGLGYNTPDERELGLTHEESVERLSSLLERYWLHMLTHPVVGRPFAAPEPGVAAPSVAVPPSDLPPPVLPSPHPSAASALLLPN